MPAPKDPIRYEEWKNKISKSRVGKIPWNKGTPHSEATKELIKKKALERSEDPEYLKRLSESAKKKPSVSDETRKKQSESQLNRRQSKKIKKECLTCHSIYEIRESHSENSRYCSRKCQGAGNSLRFKDPEERKKASDHAKERWKDPEYRKHMTEIMTGKHPSEEARMKQRECKLGEKSHFWKDGRSFDPYCPNFNRPLKHSNRKTFHFMCQFPGCGKTKEENNGRELCVHHLFTEKMACCESRIEEMETLRKRLPKEVARFGEPEFSDEEIKYIRMMIPLCMSHHQKVKSEEMKELPYEETIYRKFFVELIMNEYNGKCYETESERSSAISVEA
jgi:hypothetical protein